MASKLTIYVPDIIDIMTGGYDEIRIYRSTVATSGFSEITVSGTRPTLLIDKTRYDYNDTFGTADHWYKYSFYDLYTLSESSLSDALRGTVSGSSFRGAKYPAEIELTPPQQDMVYRIRQLIGDMKEVNRDYISATTGYDNISTDKATISIDNPKGWPLSIAVNGQHYSSITEPVVNGYQFVTFSGIAISTVSGTVDLWYEHFRFSDREILDYYSSTDAPVGLPVFAITPEMYELKAAISLLESELRSFMATSSARVSIYEEIEIDPSAGLRARQADLEALRKKLKDLIADTSKSLVSNPPANFGVRVD